MNKPLLRIVALVLIPCLVVDPATASVFTISQTPMRESVELRTIGMQISFDEQALELKSIVAFTSQDREKEASALRRTASRRDFIRSLIRGSIGTSAAFLAADLPIFAQMSAQEKSTLDQLHIRLDPDTPRVQRVSRELLTYLKERINRPQTLGPLLPVLKAVYQAANSHLYIVHEPTGILAEGLSGLRPDRSHDNRLAVNSFYFEPLLIKLKSDPFYGDILLAIAVKEGAVFVDYPTAEDTARSIVIQNAILQFESHPFMPRDHSGSEQIKLIAGHLIEGEATGFRRALQWMKYRNVNSDVLKKKKDSNPALRTLLDDMENLLDRIHKGQTPRQNELLLKTSILFKEIALSYPDLVTAVMALPEVQAARNPKDPSDLNVEKAFSWLLDEHYSGKHGQPIPIAFLTPLNGISQESAITPLSSIFILPIAAVSGFGYRSLVGSLLQRLIFSSALWTVAKVIIATIFTIGLASQTTLAQDFAPFAAATQTIAQQANAQEPGDRSVDKDLNEASSSIPNAPSSLVSSPAPTHWGIKSMFLQPFGRAVHDPSILGLMLAQSAATFADGYMTREGTKSGLYEEGDPVARIFIGRKPTWSRMAPTWATEGLAETLLGERMKRSRHIWVRRFWWMPQTMGVASHTWGASSWIGLPGTHPNGPGSALNAPPVAPPNAPKTMGVYKLKMILIPFVLGGLSFADHYYTLGQGHASVASISFHSLGTLIFEAVVGLTMMAVTTLRFLSRPRSVDRILQPLDLVLRAA